ncbi:MAG: carbamoyl phosphate synthase large subunit, partial [Myxococcota bacterium]|nr:carbamoyl phosphate synthase large subunit [Myxococcota bacterium]
CSLGPEVIERLREQTAALARALGVVGLMNVQFAIQGDEVFVLEVNPRASRTVPFVSKAIGQPLAKLAARVMGGATLEELRFTKEIWPRHFSVKEAVFPFVKFPGVDTVLGPEMKSTGEVMGIDSDFGRAYAKAQVEAGNPLPASGSVLVSVRDEDKARLAEPMRQIVDAGFRLLATPGTARVLEELGHAVEVVPKAGQGDATLDVVARIEAGDVQLVFNTVRNEPQAVRDSYAMRRAALNRGVAYFTTFAALRAAAGAVEATRRGSIGVRPLQEVHART